MPFSMQRSIIEERAAEMGKNIEDAEELIIDSVTVQRTVIAKAYEMLSNGELVPSMGDLLKALQLQQTMEAGKGGDVAEETWREAFMEYMTIVQKIVPPELFQKIGVEMTRSPTLQAIASRRNRALGL
jgi:hypothetical protein